jgi:TolB-like protein
MTAMKKGGGCVATVSADEAQAALKLILASSLFINALRSSRLLKFLVEKALSGAIRDTSEYIIGIEVFDLDPSAYCTSDNPIVRVQVGRLREKLKTYYATLGAGSDIEISIPIGGYMPTILRKSAVCIDCKQCYMLAICPLKCISQHVDGVHFTQGLNEELKHLLFKAFGKIMVLHSFIMSGDAVNDNESWTLRNVVGTEVNHLLEGSVKIDTERIRASIRLVDVSAGCIIWSEQFDRNIFFAITHQEELAASICGALKDFFAINKSVISDAVLQVM